MTISSSIFHNVQLAQLITSMSLVLNINRTIWTTDCFMQIFLLIFTTHFSCVVFSYSFSAQSLEIEYKKNGKRLLLGLKWNATVWPTTCHVNFGNLLGKDILFLVDISIFRWIGHRKVENCRRKCEIYLTYELDKVFQKDKGESEQRAKEGVLLRGRNRAPNRNPRNPRGSVGDHCCCCIVVD